jgi:hypothetical protein
MGRETKVVKLVVDSFGSFLGMEKGCIILRDKKKEKLRSILCLKKKSAR